MEKKKNKFGGIFYCLGTRNDRMGREKKQVRGDDWKHLTWLEIKVHISHIFLTNPKRQPDFEHAEQEAIYCWNAGWAHPKHTLLIPLGYLKRVGVKIFNLYVQSCFLFCFFPLCQLCFSNLVKNDRKPISFFSPPFIDPAVHSTSIYSSYLASRPKEERKVKADVELSWLLWLERNLGGGKLAVVSISRAWGCGAGVSLALRMCAFSSMAAKRVKGRV